jgi:Cdc6-like AAA superfamily ATPase
MRERSDVKGSTAVAYWPNSTVSLAMERFYTAKERSYIMNSTTEVSPADRLKRSFTPHKPIDLPEFFSGRQSLLYRGVDAVHTDGLHVVIFGDRGTGKTSLAHVLAHSLQEPDDPNGLRAIIVSCTGSDNYTSIWNKVFQEVQISQRQLGFMQEAVAPIVGRMEVADSIDDPNDVRFYIRSLTNPVVVVIDEYESVSDRSTNRLMANTIKLFADTNVNSTIALVGVADSIDDLVAEHHSISRNLAQIQLLPMPAGELVEIVQRGFKYAGLDWQPGLDTQIARLSQGYPHYTHLLGLWSGRRALEAKRSEVIQADLDQAIIDALENATGGVQQEYERAVASARRHTLFKEVLLACSLAEKDPLGRFRAADVRDPMHKITGKDYKTDAFQSHLAKFCESERGPVLKKTGTVRNYRWQFVNPQLIPFVQLEGLRTGLLPE